MGVFPSERRGFPASACLPHARGGVSCNSLAMVSNLLVFPTHVGVFPKKPPVTAAQMSLPHARGGVSRNPPQRMVRRKSSPRTWGCFHESEGERRELGVFPTHVGVFPMIRSGFPPEVCLPHARGGVSRSGRACPVLALSSPRTWGGAKQRLPPESPFLTVGAFHVYP